MHDSDRYGVLEWPMKEIAQALGCTAAPLKELVDKGVLKGCDKGECEPFVYVPRSGRRDGLPVTLIDAQTGPIWFSSRMVKDEYKRIARGEGEGIGEAPKLPPKSAPKAAPNSPLGAAPKPDIGPYTGAPPPPSPSPAAPVNTLSLPAESPRPPDREPDIDLLGHQLNGHAPKTVPDCPHLEILALWAEVMPDLPQHDPDHWPESARADHLRARWRATSALKGWASKDEGLRYFRKLFGWCRGSDFLMGKAQSRDRRPFEFELAWLVNATNWTKVHEGKFHG